MTLLGAPIPGPDGTGAGLEQDLISRAEKAAGGCVPGGLLPKEKKWGRRVGKDGSVTAFCLFVINEGDAILPQYL